MKRLLIIIFIFIVSGVIAQERKLSDINDDIRQQESKINTSTKLLSDYSANAAVSERQLALLQAKIEERENLITLYDEQIITLQKQYTINSDSILLLTKNLEITTEEYAEMIRQSYANYLINNDLALIFAAKDFNDAVQRSELLEQYNRARRQKADGIRSTRNKIEIKNQNLIAQSEELVQKRTQHHQERTKLVSDEREMEHILDKFNNQIVEIKSSITVQQRQLDKLQAEYDRIVQQSIRAAQARQATVANNTTPQKSTTQRNSNTTVNLTIQNRGTLPYPVVGTKIKKGFGNIYRSNGSQKNQGLTFACSRGATIMSVFDGVVSSINSMRNGLLGVTINHGNYHTTYAGLYSVSVKPDEQVKARQAIGKAPNTNNSNDWQIQFYMFDSSGIIDPTPWLVK